MSIGRSEVGADPGARRLPREERRISILDGATEAFARGGYAGTTMPRIAETVGITPLIVYRHFDTKEELYRSVLERVCSRLTEALDAEPEPGAFGIGAQSFLSAARQDPSGFALLWRHAAREPRFSSYADELRAEAIGAAETALGKRVPSDSLQWAAHAVVGYLVEAVLGWLEFGDPLRDDRFVTATNAALRAGVKAWSAH